FRATCCGLILSLTACLLSVVGGATSFAMLAQQLCQHSHGVLSNFDWQVLPLRVPGLGLEYLALSKPSSFLPLGHQRLLKTVRIDADFLLRRRGQAGPDCHEAGPSDPAGLHS